jgi:hypothetical protein
MIILEPNGRLCRTKRHRRALLVLTWMRLARLLKWR